jgi:UPF0755 protein
MTSAPTDSPEGEYTFEVVEGDVPATIADTLYDDGVISSPNSIRIASIFTDFDPLQTGEYTLELPADPGEIITQINEQSEQIRDLNLSSLRIPTKSVTIREGLTLDDVFAVLEEEEIAPATELEELANSPELFRAKYPFLPEPLDCEYGNLETCAKYYLEGYLYPDTYTFVIGGSALDTLEEMLDNFQRKVYDDIGDQYTSEELNRLLILASVIERETGRPLGVTDQSADELAQERSLMADVFANRTAQGIKWQSDPTVTYGTGLTVCQQTFEIDGCVFLDDPRVQTLYNTYRIDGYPVGPTTSPQRAVIDAVTNPIENDYLFFVSDKSGKKYFAATEAEHLANIEFVTELNEKIQ